MIPANIFQIYDLCSEEALPSGPVTFSTIYYPLVLTKALLITEDMREIIKIILNFHFKPDLTSLATYKERES